MRFEYKIYVANIEGIKFVIYDKMAKENIITYRLIRNDILAWTEIVNEHRVNYNVLRFDFEEYSKMIEKNLKYWVDQFNSDDLLYWYECTTLFNN